MPRFRNTITGVVVDVRDGKVPTGDYAPVEADEAGAGEGEGGGEGYEALKVADLRAEVERRNAGRDEADLLPVDGKKADLVAALQADDGGK